MANSTLKAGTAMRHGVVSRTKPGLTKYVRIVATPSLAPTVNPSW
jgi:hypothetical protein